MTPRLVGLLTFSSTTARVALRQHLGEVAVGAAVERRDAAPRCIAIPVIRSTTSGPAAKTGTSGAMASGSGSGAGGVDQHGPHPVPGPDGPLDHEVALGDEDPGQVAARRLAPPAQLVVAQADELLDPRIADVGDGDGGVRHGADHGRPAGSIIRRATATIGSSRRARPRPGGRGPRRRGSGADRRRTGGAGRRRRRGRAPIRA